MKYTTYWNKPYICNVKGNNNNLKTKDYENV